MAKKRPLTAKTMGPGKERFALADLQQTPRDFVSRELAKPPAERFEAVCFDARKAPLSRIVEWIGLLDEVQDQEDANPKNDRGYYIRRVVIVKSPRTRVPPAQRDRPDITWIATADPSDAAAIYRRHLTERFQDILGLFASKKPPQRRG
jgi:hypothetical protein